MYANEKYLTMEVIHKPTGEKRWIKCERFNPALHEKFSGAKFGSNETTVRVSTGPNVLDLSYLAKKVEKIEEPVITASPEGTEVTNDLLSEDGEIEVPELPIETLTMSAVRALAKEKGIGFTPSTKKVELIALINAAK